MKGLWGCLPVSSTRRTITNFHNGRDECETRVPHSAGDFPAARRRKDECRGLKSNIAVAIRNPRAKRHCWAIQPTPLKG